MTGESGCTPKPRLTESKQTRRHRVAAEPSAFDRILVYSQYGSDWSEWPLNDGDCGGNNMENSGCLIFAFAHAVQWLTGNRVAPESTWWRTNQNHGSVLYDFNGLGVIQRYRREEGHPVDGAVGGKVMSKWSGGEYWAPFSVFSRYRLDRAFVPGEGPFGGMP